MSDEPKSQLLLYQAPDGRTRLEVRMQGETVWLTLNQMAELFTAGQIGHIQAHQRTSSAKGNVSHRREQLLQTFNSSKPKAERTVPPVESIYNLDVIISVGYRVKSHRGTQFRIWATQRLREYIVKGFAMDDERLKRGGGGNYFEELLARIRDIRSSEKVFWRKVLEIYATSIDYDPGEQASQVFFATVQNKMHWAVHGHTAAEIVHNRASAARPNMGLTNWQGAKPTKGEAAIAKNYLTGEETEALNRTVNAYLEFAELKL